MVIGLGDIYEKLKELVTIMDNVRENTDRIVKLEDEFRGYREESRLSDAELKGYIKAILARLDMKEEISAHKVRLAEHIAACEKAKA
ncbi:MAG TPA: hypothetical protein VER35_01595 [Candidatus Limnocylindrales bacterium]|nr:hypothetical protein [Candidatus Limnocylindrales bacterium]